MTRFNPFARKSGKYGASMGRHGHDAASWDGYGKLYVRHCGGDGFYDRGGAYWGHSRVYAVWTRGGGFCAYVEARGTMEALKIVRQGPMPEGYSIMSDEDARPNGSPDMWIVTRPNGETFRHEGSFVNAMDRAWMIAEYAGRPHYVLHLSRDVDGFGKPSIGIDLAPFTGHLLDGRAHQPNREELRRVIPSRYRKALDRLSEGFSFDKHDNSKPARLDLRDARGRLLNQIVAFPVGFDF